MPTKNTNVTSAKNWKRSAPVGVVGELELPSGNTCLVKRPGLEKMIAENVLPSSITAIATEAIQEGRGKNVKNKKAASKKASERLDEAFDRMAEDPEQMAVLFDTFNRVAAFVVVEPELRYHRRQNASGDWEDIPDDERDDEVLYTDMVDLEDKGEIFEYAVGGADGRKEAASGRQFRE